MLAPFLATKFFVPPPGKNLVIRPRLLEKLNQALLPNFRLIMVSAPAGFGKTTLVSTWASDLSSCEHRPSPSVAWLSLDDRDNVPFTFWSYLITALNHQQEEIGKQALALLQTSQTPNIETILSLLINDLVQFPDNFILILDDYHLIRSPAIHHSVFFLIDHAPPNFHLIVATRVDPSLPLALLRGRGQLLEIRLSDLCFSNYEAADYLNDGLKLALPITDVISLNEKTEGWAAGLQMAGIAIQSLISMKGGPDPSQFIQTFGGTNRYILDYLVEEVLNRQPGKIKEFLLRTSILGALCGPLCDAIMDTVMVSQPVLEHLEHANLFLFPLDEDHHWYRYHTLFVDLLRSQLERTQGEIVPGLHRKAAAWYETNLYPIDAVHHWLDANEINRASQLIEVECTRLLANGMANQTLGWLESLPDSLYSMVPKLHLLYSWGLISTGQFNLVEPHLLAIERDLVDVHELQDLQAEIDATRAMIAFSSSNYANAIQFGQKALNHLPKSNHLYSGVLTGIGTAYRFFGELKLASQFLSEAAQNAEEIHHYASAVSCLCLLGDIYIDQGKLHLAKETYQHSLDLNERVSGFIPVICLANAGLSKLYYEWDDLENALSYVNEALKQVETWGNVGIQAVTYAFKALYEIAAGNFDEAARSLNSASDMAPKLASNPFVQKTMRALTIQYLLSSGQMDRAYQMVEARLKAFHPDTELNPEEQLAEISVLVALGNARHDSSMLDSALTQMNGLLPVLRESGRHYLLMQMMIQKVVALLALEHEQSAEDLFVQILAQAEPEGYVRLFVDQGTMVAGLFQKIYSANPQAEYAQRLLAAHREAVQKASILEDRKKGKLAYMEDGGETRNASLIEPLTRREMEIMQLIAEGYSNKEIAQKLYISPRTVKFYATGIYSKLGVTGRTQAVYRARELGLLQ